MLKEACTTLIEGKEIRIASAKMHRRLRQFGYKGEFSCIKMSSWCNAGCQLAHMAMPNQWFEEMKLHQLDKVQVGVLPEINR